MSGDDHERLNDLLQRARDALASGDDGPDEPVLPEAEPPEGLADRALDRLREAGLMPVGVADRAIGKLHDEDLLPAPRARSIFRRPVTGTFVRVATAACLMLSLGVMSIPETADRVEPVQRKILGEKVTRTLSRWGDAILDRWI